MSHRGRSDGSGMINNVNGFAALSGSRKKKSKGKSTVEKAAVEQKTFWAPAPLNAKSWADVDDDDDDYYATTAPPQSVWGLSGQQLKERTLLQVEESESDDDILGEGDNLDEEHDSEPEVQEDPEPMVKSFAPAMAVTEPEKQLSKKEIRKRELKELDALLADLNITPNEKNDHDEHQGAEVDKKELQRTEEEDLNESGPVESKNSKRKKKKAKSSKELKEIQNQSAREETNAEEDTATVDVKEQLKKLAAMKKRKPIKETDTAAKAAAAEAAARRQKLEAAKKKEKSHHYNQHPVR
ncbi:unnamed protein product [Rhodiola kirilowii]